ncbi:UDP-N-acetylmuramate dehydrogenase [Candidatus Erwinia haradaeae]|uniref:UDP-N-acetylenolpyruvoylglucosamine reductase n=1 Tax=Candidatus Erwinia haradaeae TaxID=1922217 RepID=A0A451D2D6_9GAMM|nr:UDP-N-acetylmuramate dehydrogenase [Candidatus Erwinia haradaeae]VFP79779.1 UDP-N-acetylenolpyruvoylglucosamine reductase [Candidatus Erwinia haradaeae]
MSYQQYPLKSWNTFGVEAYADSITIVDSIDDILSDKCKNILTTNEPILFLGEGSNVLFLQDFHGHVLINRIKGVNITEKKDAWLLHVGAGENWQNLVKTTLDKGLAGLENLALIPGCVGSAPIQNIGAYGVDLAQVCEYVDVLCLTDFSQRRLYVNECFFGYRDSIFKSIYKENYVIIAVGLCLTKHWKPVLNYGKLYDLNPNTVTPIEIFKAVCTMRRSKIPDPKYIGNAGSFFKNPLITESFAVDLFKKYPDIPHYFNNYGKIILSAGALIERCALKGYKIGNAAVYDKQALVLVNTGGANGLDIVHLASFVRRRVAEKFHVWLEPEVCFISSQGKIDAVKVLL